MKTKLKKWISGLLSMVMVLTVLSSTLISSYAQEEKPADRGATSAQHNIIWISGTNSKITENNTKIDITADSNTDQYATLQVQFSCGGDYRAEAGEVKIRVPAHIFFDREGQAADYYNLSLPKAPETGSSSVFHYYIEGDEIVITNFAPISSATYFTVDIEYRYRPSDVANGFINDEVHAHFEYPNEEGGTVSSDNTITAVNHTGAKLDGASKSAEKLYTTWNSVWGTAPADAEDYVYLVWIINAVSSKNSTQRFYLEFKESDAAPGTVIGVGQSESGLYNGATSYTTSQINPSSGANASFRTEKARVLVKYPKSLIEDLKEGERITFENKAQVELNGLDDATDIKNASGTFTYYKQPEQPEPEVPDFPEVSHAFSKSVNNFADYLYVNPIFAGETISSNGGYDGFKIKAESLYYDPVTHEPGEKIDLIDEGPVELMLGNPYNNPKIHTLSPGTDYYISSFGSLSFSQYDLQETEDGKWVVGSSPVSSKDRDDIEIYCKTADDPENWKLYGRYTPTGMVIADGMPEYDHKVAYRLPENTMGVRMIVNSTHYKTKIEFVPIITLRPSEKVKEILKNMHPESGFSGGNYNLRNTAEGTITDPAGGFLYQSTKSDWVTLDRVSVESSINKKSGTPQKDSNLGLVRTPTTITIFDQFSERDTNIPENEQMGTALNSFADTTLYDLLPAGTTVENFRVSAYTAYNNGDEESVTDISWTTKFVDNWQGSGRTMMIAHIKGTPLSTESEKNPIRGLVATYDSISTFSNLIDNGTTMTNYCGWKTNEGKYHNGNQRPSGGMWEYLADCDGDGQDDQLNGPDRVVIYDSATATATGPFYAEGGFHKAVKAENGTYGNETVVDEHGNYSYQLRFQPLASTTASNIIMYDVLENAYGSNSHWQGTLTGVNTTNAANKGAEVVVYYSTVEGIKPYDKNGSTAQGDVSNPAYWSATPPDDLSKVTALAFDMRTKKGGGDFTVKGGSSVYVEIFMQATTKNGAAPNSNMKAYNDAACLATLMSVGGGSSTSTESSNIVTVQTNPGPSVDWGFTKVNAENTMTALPGAEFTLYQLTCTNTEADHTHDELASADSACWTVYEVQTSAEETGEVTFSALPAGTYMLVETKAPDGFVKPAGQWKLTVDPEAQEPVVIESVGDTLPPAFMTEADGSLKLPNIAILIPPMTGGIGTYLFAAGGSALLIGAAGLLLAFRKRKLGRA
ncbi:SpaA isopeptide-forming pilin-related protein [Hydrogeniiclostridium mannosilyticum]|uniref:SpaA isopeptide-forming pilin-related protein n=1 Tax=Hydrogeniiclostridium mannosilyticum TaxID=2764322 RepID=UPI003999E64E